MDEAAIALSAKKLQIVSMISFASDNTSGTHPLFLKAILDANSGQTPSYGMDPWTEEFESELAREFGAPISGALVFNGTAANVLGLSSVLKSHEGVICAESSHLAMDECGAPEKWLGAKLFLVPTLNGKLQLDQASKHLIRRGDQHFSQAKVLSITQPTEWGTTYSIQELLEVRDFCKKNKLFFHMDGARLANAASTLGVGLRAITRDVGVDILSLGGTKNGMMGAEAVVFLNPELGREFKFIRKQGLNLASKQRFLAAQFSMYLKDQNWKAIADHQTRLAQILASKVKDSVEVVAPVESNAVFAKIPKKAIGLLKDEFFFYVWDEAESIVRWMITWDHTEEQVLKFAESIKRITSSLRGQH